MIKKKERREEKRVRAMEKAEREGDRETKKIEGAKRKRYRKIVT